MTNRMKDCLFLLDQSLRKIFQRLKQTIPAKSKVGIMVSGGVDSSVIAKIASSYFPNLYLLSCGTREGKDFPFVKLLESHLQKPLFYLKVTEKQVQESLILVERLLKREGLKVNLINLSLGLSFFLVLKDGKEKSISYFLTGQGPDDLLAGYHKYRKVSLNKLKEKIKEGFSKAFKIDKKRDDAMASFLKVKLYHPYLEKEFVKASFNLPPNLKLFRTRERVIEKYILRKLAEKLSLPKKICWRKKAAFQYSTRIQKMVQNLTQSPCVCF